MYRTILVSLDGSALSERALPVATALVTLIAGGLHLAGVAEEDLGRACRRLAAMTAATPPLQRVYPGHCTGEAFLALARALGTMVVCSSPVGTVIPFGE